MKKILLTDYEVEIEKNGKKEKLPWKVKESIVEILFQSELNLAGREFLKQEELAKKIENCKEDAILLETEEYNRIVRAVEATKGLARNAVEFVKRVIEAEDVEVQEKK